MRERETGGRKIDWKEKGEIYSTHSMYRIMSPHTHATTPWANNSERGREGREEDR